MTSSEIPSALWRVLSDDRPRSKLPKGLDAAWVAAGAVLQPLVPRRSRLVRRAGGITTAAESLRQISNEVLRDRMEEMRCLFRRGRQEPAHTDHAFALITEAADRCLGLRPRLNQIAAALAMEAGCLAEMATGEGKTLAATLPAVLAGWRGRGCHVVTHNDYLAKRDGTELKPLYQLCGLRVSFIEEQMIESDRRMAYRADVTYCTNKSVTADFLRDKLVLGRVRGLPAALLAKHAGLVGREQIDRLVLRGLECAIVDEADSLLIDESVTPLIISGNAPNAEQVEAFQQAAALATQLECIRDYRVNHRFREIDLTRSGRDKLAALTNAWGGVWTGVRRREELVNQALCAAELYTVGKEYVIQEAKIVIVDEFTGRLMPDRTWRDGLHQAVEAKEGLEVQSPKSTLARISFQRFFRMYRKLSGMTGTAWENRNEFWQVYRMPVVRIPTYRPCIRKYRRDQTFANAAAKWEAIADQVAEIHQEGRPILVGTRSVSASEQLSSLLTRRGLDHQVLNAVRHQEEAEVVALAGQPKRITVATNMAGRGTDIKLGEGVVALGGLHVIASERHEAGRIDRQLFGRSARQGDPGSVVMFSSFDDDLIKRHESKVSRFRRLVGRKSFVSAQKHAEQRARRQRKAVLRTDDWLDEFLGFAGTEH